MIAGTFVCYTPETARDHEEPGRKRGLGRGSRPGWWWTRRGA